MWGDIDARRSRPNRPYRAGLFNGCEHVPHGGVPVHHGSLTHSLDAMSPAKSPPPTGCSHEHTGILVAAPGALALRSTGHVRVPTRTTVMLMPPPTTEGLHAASTTVSRLGPQAFSALVTYPEQPVAHAGRCAPPEQAHPCRVWKWMQPGLPPEESTQDASGREVKFDRGSLRAWLVFIGTGIVIIVVSLYANVLGLARRQKRGATPRLVLHSHEFAGNVRALADFAPRPHLKRWDVRFLYLDPRKYRAHDHDNVGALLALRPSHLLWVTRADILVCTHGLGILRNLRRSCPWLHVVDVWHGIGFKSRREYVQTVRGFSRLLLPSPWAASFVQSCGVPGDVIRVTGHGAWDPLLAERNRDELLHRYQLHGDYRARILVAPTWTHGALGSERQVFGTDWSTVSQRLAEWAIQNSVLLIFRSHLNAGSGLEEAPGNVVNRPYSEYPLTYDLLSVADILITDWSSIGSDFLPTGRPIIYLDVPPPFELGYLDARDRVGPHPSSTGELIAALDESVQLPDLLRQRYEDRRKHLEEKVCGGYADGRVAERYLAELDALLEDR